MPESFEWLILSSGLIDGNRIMGMIEQPEDYIESSEFFSWEQFFTKLLIKETMGTHLQYSKSKLNATYLDEKHKSRLLKVINVIHRKLGL